MGKRPASIQHFRRGGEVGIDKQKKPAKYRNKKVECGGMKFDSIREFERY